MLSFEFGIVELVLVHLLAVLLADGFSLVHTVIYSTYKQAHNKEKEIKFLSLSTNRENLRYGDRNNILGEFSNGTARIILGMAWSSFGIIRGFLVHGMIG